MYTVFSVFPRRYFVNTPFSHHIWRDEVCRGEYKLEIAAVLWLLARWPRACKGEVSSASDPGLRLGVSHFLCFSITSLAFLQRLQSTLGRIFGGCYLVGTKGVARAGHLDIHV